MVAILAILAFIMLTPMIGRALGEATWWCLDFEERGERAARRRAKSSRSMRAKNRKRDARGRFVKEVA